MDGLTASDVALMNRDGGWDGMSFMWIFALLILAGGGFGGFGLGNNRGLGYENYATSNEVQRGFDNQNAMANQREILTAVNAGTAQAVSATQQAKYDNINVAKDIQSALQMQIANVATMEQGIVDKLQTCCCETNRNIDSVNYNNAMNTASINANTTAQTQKILDALAQSKIESLQNQVNQLQLQQAVTGVVRYPMQTTYSSGCNPFCGCACGA